MRDYNIKLVKEEDIKDILEGKIKTSKLDWDAEIGGVPYQIIDIPGYVHTIGGKMDYGSGNSYWCYPLNEELTIGNLRQYNGIPGGVAWGIKYCPTMYHEFKYEASIEAFNNNVAITRNGQIFYTERLTLLDAIHMIKDNVFDEHPLELNSRDFDKKCIGRKIWWRSQPAVIESYVKHQACIIIRPEGTDRFVQPPEFVDDDMFADFDEPTIKATIFDQHIWWWRDDED